MRQNQFLNNSHIKLLKTFSANLFSNFLIVIQSWVCKVFNSATNLTCTDYFDKSPLDP